MTKHGYCNSERRQSLRSQTRTAHAALDQHPLLCPLTDPAIPPQTYRRALLALYPGFCWLEQQLADYKPRMLSVDWMPRAALLAQDIEQMGAVPPSTPALDVPTRPEDAAFWLGLCYVHEGARHGGRLIAQRLAGRDDLARRFFVAASAPGCWQILWDEMERLSPDVFEQSVVAGAQAGFAAVLQAIDRQWIRPNQAAMPPVKQK